MKENIPCIDCSKERMIDTKKWSVERYLARSPRCRKCATRQPELIAKISKGWMTKERLLGNLFRSGKAPWNKGVKGYMGANSTSFKKGQTTGEKNKNWKGGITPENTRLRTSEEARLHRKIVFRRDNYTCQSCGIRGGTLELDHVMPWAHYPDLRFEILNGRTLCADCHRRTPTYKNRKNIYA